jgi:uncharacterized protein (TIGR02265 family)
MTAATNIQIKGSVLRTRLALVEELAPGGGVSRVLARLPLEDRTTLNALLVSSWYPFELGRKLDEAIVAELGGGRAEFFERLGEASAERNLGPGCPHRRFLVPGDPHGFLEKTPLIYSYYYDQGRREYQRTGEREAVLTTLDAETFSAPDCLTVIGWHRRALEMCGATNVRVIEEECRARGAATCRYRLSWA